MIAVQAIRPIATANWTSTRALRSRPEPPGSAVERFAFRTDGGLEARQIESRVGAGHAADEQDQ